MSYFCNIHGPSSDACDDCLQKAVVLIKQMIEDHEVYEQSLNWNPTETVLEAKEFLKHLGKVS